MSSAEYTLVIVNLVLGFGCVVPLARLLRLIDRKSRAVFQYVISLLIIYFVECVAVIIGMGTPVFSVGLAILWGIMFGLWLRTRASATNTLKTALLLTIYTSLPAASFIVIPIVVMFGGWDIMSVAEGTRFGIPGFIPYPLNTILGFYTACAIGAVVLKIAITTSIVRLFLHLKKSPL